MSTGTKLPSTGWPRLPRQQMPGALLMAAGILLCDFGAVNLVRFGFIFSAHFVLGWIYLFLSRFFLPRISEAQPKGNPFTNRN